MKLQCKKKQKKLLDARQQHRLKKQTGQRSDERTSHVFVILTLSESKQAITLPFSTWQLLAGWANLHSLSGREHVPLWNSRQTSNVSHFVSLICVTFTAILDQAEGVDRGDYVSGKCNCNDLFVFLMTLGQTTRIDKQRTWEKDGFKGFFPTALILR